MGDLVMKFDNKCICCGSSSNLDTILTVTVDDVKYQVTVCDEHAEDITPKQVKEKVREKINEYNQLVDKMKEFGMDVTESSPGGIMVAEDSTKSSETEESEEKPSKKRKILLANTDGEVVADKEAGKQPRVIKKKVLPKVRSVSGALASKSGNRMSIEARESVDAAAAVESEIIAAKKKGKGKETVEVEVPVTEDIEYQTVPGRGGRPMRIPKRIKHNQGSTKVAIVNTGGDRTIQDRFREMADISKRTGMEGHIYGRDGYDTVPCNMCDGSGIAKATGEECPKCKGVGQLNRGWLRDGRR
jgi:hypothetical protein